MDGWKNAVFTDKSIRLLSKNDHSFDVESGSMRIEIQHWVELFFALKAIAVVYLSKNSKSPTHNVWGFARKLRLVPNDYSSRCCKLVWTLEFSRKIWVCVYSCLCIRFGVNGCVLGVSSIGYSKDAKSERNVLYSEWIGTIRFGYISLVLLGCYQMIVTMPKM